MEGSFWWILAIFSMLSYFGGEFFAMMLARYKSKDFVLNSVSKSTSNFLFAFELVLCFTTIFPNILVSPAGEKHKKNPGIFAFLQIISVIFSIGIVALFSDFFGYYSGLIFGIGFLGIARSRVFPVKEVKVLRRRLKRAFNFLEKTVGYPDPAFRSKVEETFEQAKQEIATIDKMLDILATLTQDNESLQQRRKKLEEEKEALLKMLYRIVDLVKRRTVDLVGLDLTEGPTGEIVTCQETLEELQANTQSIVHEVRQLNVQIQQG